LAANGKESRRERIREKEIDNNRRRIKWLAQNNNLEAGN